MSENPFELLHFVMDNEQTLRLIEDDDDQDDDIETLRIIIGRRHCPLSEILKVETCRIRRILANQRLTMQGFVTGVTHYLQNQFREDFRMTRAHFEVKKLNVFFSLVFNLIKYLKLGVV